MWLLNTVNTEKEKLQNFSISINVLSIKTKLSINQYIFGVLTTRCQKYRDIMQYHNY